MRPNSVLKKFLWSMAVITAVWWWQPPITTKAQESAHQLMCDGTKDCLARNGNDEEFQLEFWRWGYFDSTTVKAVVSVKNATNRHIATMTWNCKLYVKDQVVSRSSLVTFNVVPKKAITTETVFLHANGGMFDSNGAYCDLVHREDWTFENTRLFSASSEQITLPLDDTRFWVNGARAIHGSNIGVDVSTPK
jgi:hypothetical protein